MNYGALIKGLFAEARRGIRFEEMNIIGKIMAVFGLLPFIILSAFSAAGFYVTLFFYKALTAPIEFLHKTVREEGQQVKHATQVIVYWIGFPLVFFLYAFVAFLTIGFYFQWFFLMLLIYITTLGGVKWQPFVSEAKYDEEVDYECFPGVTGTSIFVVILAVLFLLFVVSILFDLYEVQGLFIILYMVTAIVVNLLLFKKTPYNVTKKAE